MARGPDGPGGTSITPTTGGYPRFDDPAGSMRIDRVYEGTDIDLMGSDKGLINRIAQELAAPPDYSEAGSLFGDEEGSAFKANREGVVASIACLIYAERLAHLKREINRDELAQFQQIARDAVRVNALGRMVCDCPIQDSLGFCPIANGGVYSKTGKKFNPISEKSASELVGATSSEREIDRMGAIAISEKLVNIRSLQRRATDPVVPIMVCKSSITELERQKLFAITDHFEGWKEKNSPLETKAIKTEPLSLPL